MSDDPDRRGRFEAVVAQVHDPLQRYLRRRADADDAADAFAEALLVVWRRLELVPADDPLPWCYGVARRCLANQRRSRGRRLRLVSRLAAHRRPGDLTAPAADADPTTTDPQLEAALCALPDTDQEVLRLWAWEQLEPREMALVLGTSANAVSSRLARAKRRLAAALHDEQRRAAEDDAPEPPTPRHDRGPAGHQHVVRTTDTHEGEHRP